MRGLRRLRRQRLASDLDNRPPSILVTTLAARAYTEAGQHAAEARELRAKADALAQEATEATNRAVRELAAAGFTYRDIGTMTGVSYQRAQQIAPSKARTRRSKSRRRVPA